MFDALFLSHVEKHENGCWMWTGSQVVSRGLYLYGHLGRRINGKLITKLAHRVAYEGTYGPIPKGLQIDHLCKNTLCVNPEHLEAVTPKVNMRRSNRCKRSIA